MYTSSNNGILPAVAWTQSDAPSLKWSSVASSSDGKKLAAVAEDGGIYISNNSGVSWKLSSAPSKFQYFNNGCPSPRHPTGQSWRLLFFMEGFTPATTVAYLGH